MRAGLRVGRSVGVDPTGPDAEHVAGAQLDPLRGDDLTQFVGVDRLAGQRVVVAALALTVGDDVEQHAASHDPVLGPVLDPERAAAGRERLGPAAEEAVLAGAHVPQAVPLRGALRVERVQAVIERVAVRVEDLMLDRRRPNSGGSGSVIGRLRLTTVPDRAEPIAACTVCSLVFCNVPRSRSSTFHACCSPSASSTGKLIERHERRRVDARVAARTACSFRTWSGVGHGDQSGGVRRLLLPALPTIRLVDTAVNRRAFRAPTSIVYGKPSASPGAASPCGTDGLDPQT